MVDELRLAAGIDIPFVEAGLTLHQPSIKEIAYLGEENVLLGARILLVSKNDLTNADNVNLDNVSNFDVKTTLSGMVFNVKSELFGYDTRKNPFGAFPEAFKAFSINYMMGSAPMAVFSKNNYKYLKVSLEGGPSQGINCDFKYDGDGYPTTGTRDNGTKITFEYY